mgnify:CR=1 FL=1
MVNNVQIETIRLSSYFGATKALEDISISIYKNEILSIIGPANSGKTTFLRALNRMNYLNIAYRQEGDIIFGGINIKDISDTILRRKVGIIFALPQVLPVSIYDNIAYGPRMHGTKNKYEIDKVVEDSLKRAYLWDEVKNRLRSAAMKLSGGQQQRLCIARTLAVEPDIILYDEPCSGLDPISTAKVEEAMGNLRKNYTQIIVTNNTKQAARVSQRCAFFLMGKMIEINDTSTLFTAPSDKRTDDYISGRFG